MNSPEERTETASAERAVVMGPAFLWTISTHHSLGAVQPSPVTPKGTKVRRVRVGTKTTIVAMLTHSAEAMLSEARPPYAGESMKENLYERTGNR